MKKQWRTIIISGVVLVALLLTWLISALIPAKQTEATTTTTTAEVAAVFETDEANIAQIDVSNDNGGFTLLAEQVKDKSGNISVIWSVKGKTDYPFSSSTIGDVATLASLVYASGEIATDATDLKSYGLDKPMATITVTLTSGEKHVIKFGNEIISGYYNYAMLDNSGRVCTVASTSVDKAKFTTLDLLDSSLVCGLNVNDLTYLAFERSSDDAKLAMNVALIGTAGEDSAYLEFNVVDPIKRSGSSDKLTTLATEAAAVAVTKFVEIDPRDLSKYGLDKPQYTFTLKTAAKNIVIKIGNAADKSSYYAISDAVPAVFTLANTAFTTIDMKVIEMLDRFIALESIWNVSRIDGNLFGTKFTTTMEMTNDQRADDDGVVFTMDGENARIFSEDDDSLFSQFYQRIIGIMMAGLDTKATPVNLHNASLTYYIKEDTANSVAAHTKLVEFSRRDDYTYYVFIDGTYTGFYVDGETTFTSAKTDSEGLVVAYKKMKYAIAHAVDGIFNTEEGYQLD